jgi:hypothetical protein
MIRIAAALALAAAVTGACAPVEASRGPRLLDEIRGRVLVVRDDPGGILQDRFKEVERLRKSGVRVEIQGKCNSACTLYLGLPQTCVHPGARLGFHGPSRMDGSALHPARHGILTVMMSFHYPEEIQEVFLREARHLRGDDMMRIDGEEAIRMGARSCGRSIQEGDLSIGM